MLFFLLSRGQSCFLKVVNVMHFSIILTPVDSGNCQNSDIMRDIDVPSSSSYLQYLLEHQTHKI